MGMVTIRTRESNVKTRSYAPAHVIYRSLGLLVRECVLTCTDYVRRWIIFSERKARWNLRPSNCSSADILHPHIFRTSNMLHVHRQNSLCPVEEHS